MRHRVLVAATAALVTGLLAGCATTTAGARAPDSPASAQVRTYGVRASTAAGAASTGALPAGASSPGTDSAGSASAATVTEGSCTTPVAARALAARLSLNIRQALAGRPGNRSVAVYDRVSGVSCAVNATRHYDAASIAKAIILAALLRWHQQLGTPLSATDKREATAMITHSDNGAADYLWGKVGPDRLRDFLAAARMTHTRLGGGKLWGLTQVTAHDEMLLLRLLDAPNPVLSNASRKYELGLMSKVISAQRWGTPAGAPSGVRAHVKNGWLPDSTGWHVNSLGMFSGNGADYLIVVLTDRNGTENAGIATIQNVARVVHRDVGEAAAASATARLAASTAPQPVSPAASRAHATPSVYLTGPGGVSSWAVVSALPTPLDTTATSVTSSPGP